MEWMEAGQTARVLKYYFKNIISRDSYSVLEATLLTHTIPQLAQKLPYSSSAYLGSYSAVKSSLVIQLMYSR